MTSTMADMANDVSCLAHMVRGTCEQQRWLVRHVNLVQGMKQPWWQ